MAPIAPTGVEIDAIRQQNEKRREILVSGGKICEKIGKGAQFSEEIVKSLSDYFRKAHRQISFPSCNT